MEKLKLFNGTVCEVMTLANGKCLVRDCMGEVNEVYKYELQDIPLSKELLEHLGFRFDAVDYGIKMWRCYRLTKVEKVYLSPSFFVEEEMFTPPIGYTITADGEEEFRISFHKRIDDRVGTYKVEDLNEFLNLCDRLGCHIDVCPKRLNVFMRNKTMGSDRF